jgi:hypothetical protein
VYDVIDERCELEHEPACVTQPWFVSRFTPDATHLVLKLSLINGGCHDAGTIANADLE